MTANALISTLYQKRDVNQLNRLKDTIEDKVKELDLFFEEYLELFDEKMNATIDNQSDPVWKAYQTRYEEYKQVKADLKLVNYYLGMI